jgi:hypothetical protein
MTCASVTGGTKTMMTTKSGRPKKPSHLTLTLTVTVARRDAGAVKKALLEALGGDFYALYAARERPATPEETEGYRAEFI